jgi:hypothetical protein
MVIKLERQFIHNFEICVELLQGQGTLKVRKDAQGSGLSIPNTLITYVTRLSGPTGPVKSNLFSYKRMAVALITFRKHAFYSTLFYLDSNSF